MAEKMQVKPSSTSSTDASCPDSNDIYNSYLIKIKLVYFCQSRAEWNTLHFQFPATYFKVFSQFQTLYSNTYALNV